MASPFLGAYLHLEREMMSLDRRSDPAAERLRDFMDPLWHDLDDEDRDYLNSRQSESLGVLHTLIVSGGYLAPTSLEQHGVEETKTGQEYSDGELVFPLEDVLMAA